MEVILLENIGNLGGLGDKVDVKAGFGRNYLIPQGKAVPATEINTAEFETRRAELEAAAQRRSWSSSTSRVWGQSPSGDSPRTTGAGLRPAPSCYVISARLSGGEATRRRPAPSRGIPPGRRMTNDQLPIPSQIPMPNVAVDPTCRFWSFPG